MVKEQRGGKRRDEFENDTQEKYSSAMTETSRQHCTMENHFLMLNDGKSFFIAFPRKGERKHQIAKNESHAHDRIR